MTEAVAGAETKLDGRLDFVDMLRGLVICLMVLDHTRDFVHKTAFVFDPLDLDKTSVAVFLTR